MDDAEGTEGTAVVDAVGDAVLAKLDIESVKAAVKVVDAAAAFDFAVTVTRVHFKESKIVTFGPMVERIVGAWQDRLTPTHLERVRRDLVKHMKTLMPVADVLDASENLQALVAARVIDLYAAHHDGMEVVRDIMRDGEPILLARLTPTERRFLLVLNDFCHKAASAVRLPGET